MVLLVERVVFIIVPSICVPLKPVCLWVLFLPFPLTPPFFLFCLVARPPPPFLGLALELFVIPLQPPLLELVVAPVGVGVSVVIVVTIVGVFAGNFCLKFALTKSP